MCLCIQGHYRRIFSFETFIAYNYTLQQSEKCIVCANSSVSVEKCPEGLMRFPGGVFVNALAFL